MKSWLIHAYWMNFLECAVHTGNWTRTVWKACWMCENWIFVWQWCCQQISLPLLFARYIRWMCARRAIHCSHWNNIFGFLFCSKKKRKYLWIENYVFSPSSSSSIFFIHICVPCNLCAAYCCCRKTWEVMREEESFCVRLDYESNCKVDKIARFFLFDVFQFKFNTVQSRSEFRVLSISFHQYRLVPITRKKIVISKESDIHWCSRLAVFPFIRLKMRNVERGGGGWSWTKYVCVERTQFFFLPSAASTHS